MEVKGLIHAAVIKFKEGNIHGLQTINQTKIDSMIIYMANKLSVNEV
jgi:hypothetical protein